MYWISVKTSLFRFFFFFSDLKLWPAPRSHCQAHSPGVHVTEPGPFLLQVSRRVNVCLNVGPRKAQFRITGRDRSVQRFPDSILDMAVQRSFLTGFLKNPIP